MNDTLPDRPRPRVRRRRGEDSLRPLVYHLDLRRAVEFARLDVVSKNVCFAAFGPVKAGAGG